MVKQLKMKIFKILGVAIVTIFLSSCSTDEEMTDENNSIIGTWLRVDEDIPITEESQVEEYLNQLRNETIKFDPYYNCKWKDYREFRENGEIDLINYYGDDTNDCGIDDEQYGSWYFQGNTLMVDWGSNNQNIDEAFMVRKNDTLVLGWYYDGPSNPPTHIGVFIRE